MSAREQARDPIQRWTEIVSVAFFRRACVNGDADAQPVMLRCNSTIKPPSSPKRCSQRGRRCSKGDAESVPNGFENVPPRRGEGAA
jgi:hypothetical protein